jgi:hypothetical protein
MREYLTVDDVTPEQRQIFQAAGTLINFPRLLAQYGEQFANSHEPYQIQAKALQSVSSVELYYIELKVGTAIFGGCVFAALPLDALPLSAVCGQHTPETLLPQWTQVNTTHHTYALRLLCFLPEHWAFNMAVVKALVCNLKQDLQRQGSLLAVERFSHLLERELAVVDSK